MAQENGMDGLFGDMENGQELYQSVQQLLTDLNISEKSLEGRILLERAAFYMALGIDPNDALIQAFPESITHDREKTEWLNVKPISPWDKMRRKRSELRLYDIPSMYPTVYRFEVHFGSVNNLPVTEYVLAHGERERRLWRPHSPAKGFNEIAGGIFTLWEPGIRVVARGTRGLEERRNGIMPTSPIHGEGVS